MAMIERSMSTAGRAWRSGRADWRLHVLSVFSLSVAFVCLASALLVVVNLYAVQLRWGRAGRASIYLRDGTTEAALAPLRAALESTAGVTRVRYVSGADARKDMLADGTGGTLAALADDAFPASIELDLDQEASEQDIATLATKLRALPPVEAVETYQRWTDRLGALLRGGVTASSVLALVVLGAVVSVVSSTIRLALHRRKVEVEVLRLVGATERFVRGPFVVEGAVEGALGAVASLLLLGLLYLIVRGRFDDDLAALLGIAPVFLPWQISLGMIVLGGSLGAIAAAAGVRKHLTV